MVNYGHDGMLGDLDVAEGDRIVCGTQEMYSHCRALGLTHLIYAGSRNVLDLGNWVDAGFVPKK